MQSWRSAIGYGLLVWLIPFAVAFGVFAIKESWRSLFESIMAVTLAATVVGCVWLYFRQRRASAREGLQLGLLWYLISVAIDLPLMLSPPINYTFSEYLADIGLTYVMIPIITTGIAAGRAGAWSRRAQSIKL
jgi:hypothetical protein